MSNKYLTSDKRRLLIDRLDKLSKNLVKANSSDSFQTNEQVISEAIRVLNTFYRDLTTPIFRPETIIAADLPSLAIYNQIFFDIFDDLSIIFSELENIEAFSVSNFNSISTEANRLFSRLKSVSSKLGDYLLYAEDITKTGLKFTDSFNNALKLDINSSLLNTSECNLNQDEGIITLPINMDKTVLINVTETPVIDKISSNGVVGNNEEVDTFGRPVQRHNDINVILDNNPDTWFEYELVVDPKTVVKSLILDLTINLGSPKVINHIVVNPNNFGTKTSVKIIDIRSSLDGKKDNYISIKDEIPLAGFSTSGDENSDFVLAPSTSKYAGQGIYTFTPRKAKYVRFRFEQSERYTINVNANNAKKSRYAIGIRDINIYGLVFEPKGEIISRAFVSNNEIKKAILDSSQNPSSYSELGAIQYFLSPNDGQDWYEIQTRGFTGRSGEISEIPEILNFNTVDVGSILTSTPIYSLRLKSVLSRNDENFTEEKAASFQQISKFTTELHSIPIEPPFSFQLEKTPIDGSVSISQPFFSARGRKASQYEIKAGGKQSFYPFGGTKMLYPFKKKLISSSPFEIYDTVQSELSDFFHVFVAGEEWTGTQSLDSYTPTGLRYAKERRYFNFNMNTGLLSFGNGSNTRRPDSDGYEDSYIAVYLDAEKLHFTKEGDDYYSTPGFRTNLNKNDFVIKRYRPVMSTTEILAKGTTEVHLSHSNIIDISDIVTKLGGTQKTYVNGREELSTDGDWSIDIEYGIIYLYTSTSSASDIVVQYTYQQVDELSDDEWDWDEERVDRLFIKGNSFETFKREGLALPSSNNRKVLHLADLDIVKGTVSFNVVDSVGKSITDSVNPFLEEVNFLDGTRELYIKGLSPEIVKEKLKYLTKVAYGISDPYHWIVLFKLSEKITTNASYDKVVISNTTGKFPFRSEKTSSFSGLTFQSTAYYDALRILLSTLFDYCIDRTNSIIAARFTGVYKDPMDGTTSWGDIEYYKERLLTATTLGRYSIDYKKGIVYTDRPMHSDWDIRANYEYSDYRAYYGMAREIPSKDYSVNIPERTIVLNEKEILNRYSLPESRSGLYYSINYLYAEQSRTDISELKDYFTPVLKDYSLRMITDKDLF